MSFRDVQTATDVIQYQKRLTDGYTDRPQIIQQIIEAIQQLEVARPTVAELCVGPGQLAQEMCAAIPTIRYIGLDFIQPFLDFTADKLAAIQADAAFVHADLTGQDWDSQLAQAAQPASFDAIVSMQSIHDVGGAERAAVIYQRCHQLLAPNGIFINADLITQVGEEANARPGRLTAPHHLTLLNAAGFAHSDCLFQNDQFALCVGRK